MTEKPAPVPRSWWSSLAGVLTAVAAVITALTGLFAALHQAALFKAAPPPPAVATRDTPPGTSGTRGQAPATGRPADPPPPTAAGTPGPGIEVRVMAVHWDAAGLLLRYRVINTGRSPTIFDPDRQAQLVAAGGGELVARRTRPGFQTIEPGAAIEFEGVYAPPSPTAEAASLRIRGASGEIAALIALPP
jgi:hypothetical protein